MTIFKEAARGGYPPPERFALSGLEQMRAFLSEHGPIPPIGHLTGLRFEEVGEGFATFSLPVTPWLLNHHGFVPGGMLAVLVDAPLGCAVHTNLPPRTPYTTAELSLSFLRPVTLESESLSARGELVHGGRSLALSAVRVTDARDRLVAHGTSRCFVFPPLEEPPVRPPAAPRTEDSGAPDPYLRTPEGTVLAKDAVVEKDGRAMVEAWLSGELGPPPIGELTGLRPLEADDGRATFELPASEWLCSPLGLIQGGALALLADAALAGAVQTTVAAGSVGVTADLKINFLRPVSPDLTLLTGSARVVHGGRTIAVANAELLSAAGERVALATGSSMIR